MRVKKSVHYPAIHLYEAISISRSGVKEQYILCRAQNTILYCPWTVVIRDPLLVLKSQLSRYSVTEDDQSLSALPKESIRLVRRP
jgi:hypothetical protein